MCEVDIMIPGTPMKRSIFENIRLLLLIMSVCRAYRLTLRADTRGPSHASKAPQHPKETEYDSNASPQLDILRLEQALTCQFEHRYIHRLDEMVRVGMKLIEHGTRTEQAIPAQIHAVEWVDAHLSSILCSAGPENNGPGHMYSLISRFGGSEVPQMKRDGSREVRLARVCGWGSQLEKPVRAPAVNSPVWGFEVCFARDGSQCGEIV
jgi:hypothetical protein